MSEIYPSVRLAIRDSVTRILFDRPGQWLTTADLLNHCEEAETSDTLAKILSDMAKTGRLVRGLKTLNAQGREVNTWGLSPRLRDKITSGKLLAQSPPLPVESREDEAPARAPETPRGAQTIRELMWSVPEYAALKRPIDRIDEPDALPERACKAHGLPQGFTLAEPDKPIETPQPIQAAATYIHYHHLPERWLPELRLRLLGCDGRDDPVITLRVNTEGAGAFWSLETRGVIPFDQGEAAFLPHLGDALCQFIDALYPYGVKPGAK